MDELYINSPHSELLWGGKLAIQLKRLFHAAKLGVSELNCSFWHSGFIFSAEVSASWSTRCKYLNSTTNSNVMLWMPTLQFSNELHFIFSQAINASPIFFLPLTGTIQFSSPGLDHLCLLATLGGGEIEYTSEVFLWSLLLLLMWVYASGNCRKTHSHLDPVKRLPSWSSLPPKKKAQQHDGFNLNFTNSVSEHIHPTFTGNMSGIFSDRSHVILSHNCYSPPSATESGLYGVDNKTVLKRKRAFITPSPYPTNQPGTTHIA